MTIVPTSASTRRSQYLTLRFATGREFEEAAEQALNELGAPNLARRVEVSDAEWSGIDKRNIDCPYDSSRLDSSKIR